MRRVKARAYAVVRWQPHTKRWDADIQLLAALNEDDEPAPAPGYLTSAAWLREDFSTFQREAEEALAGQPAGVYVLGVIMDSWYDGYPTCEWDMAMTFGAPVRVFSPAARRADARHARAETLYWRAHRPRKRSARKVLDALCARSWRREEATRAAWARAARSAPRPPMPEEI